MKFLILFLSIFFIHSMSIAQFHYSTKNKKAIKLFEKGQKAPNESLDPVTHIPNYKLGLNYFNQALKKDPRFWEAHVFAGEYCEMLLDYPSAIAHYEAAIQINPQHSKTGSTYFYAANLYQALGNYEKGLQFSDQFINYKKIAPSSIPNNELVKKAYFIRENCLFALDAIQHPMSFNPKNVGEGINTIDPEYFPTITVDGKTLLFTRRIKDENAQNLRKLQEDFFVSYFEKTWNKAQPMPKNINTNLNEGAPSIAADGRSLIFVACSDQSGTNNYGNERTGKGSCDLFFTKKLGSKWLNPINLPGSVNTGTWESQPSLSADGKTLYFIRRVNKRGEAANSDIYVSHLLENGDWSTAEALPSNINTLAEEESVLIHPDGKTLYFASRGHIGMGGSDLYLSTLEDNGNWSNPKNLGYPINTHFDENSLLVSAEGTIAYFASNRTGGFGDLDIYSFEMPEELRPTKTLYFEGLVYDATTQKPLGGKFQLIDLQTGKEIIFSEADKLTGEFLVSLPIHKTYALNVSYPGYTFYSENFNMKDSLNRTAFHMNIPMIPITSEQPNLLANVFFDLGKANLRNESFVELNKLVDFLQKNPTLSIEISGHTDNRGDASANVTLSTERAKAVYQYLCDKGITQKRLTYKGYGASQPINTSEEIEKITDAFAKEKAHQMNRRTEYKLLK
ncbi:MAG: PD40 domain-containing protein [Crocinitomicaceae bacterium]|nr:PD40 domain-containing protein [Crocinitomicaceae bacterium]